MNSNLAELSNRYLEARARVDALKQELKDASAEKDLVEQALIDAMVDAGITSFKNGDGVGLRMQRDEYWSCPPENRDKLYALFRSDPDLQSMFTVNSQTLNRFAKDRAEQNGGVLDEPYASLLKLYDEKFSVRVDGFRKWKGGA